MRTLLFAIVPLTCFTPLHAQVANPGQVTKDAATNKVNSNIYDAANNGVNKAEGTIKGLFKKKAKPGEADNPVNKPGGNSGAASDAAPATPAGYRSYSNYDFVPGDNVLFEDHFEDDQDGEFPAHWELEAGQGVLNKLGGKESFSLTEGNYVIVHPRLKTKTYLTDPFTVEFDYYPMVGGSSYGINVFLYYTDKDGSEQRGQVGFNENGNVSTSGFPSNDFNADYPGGAGDDAYHNKWHHGALIYKNGQLKCYLDQYRVLVVPSLNVVPAAVAFGGIGDQQTPIVFNDVRVASGGQMNMIGRKFTESKIVTHGINFDVDKAVIRPESMGTLNMIVKVMNDNPGVKFEIGGHTDNTGTAAHNLTLSQQRADAVKTQLVSMGIDVARLSTKGYGDTKPISDNNAPEGKANNRRVEFVKQ